jgi:hypothetical protein
MVRAAAVASRPLERFAGQQAAGHADVVNGLLRVEFAAHRPAQHPERDLFHQPRRSNLLRGGIIGAGHRKDQIPHRVISGGSGLRPDGLGRRNHRVCKMLVPQSISARIGHEVRDGCSGAAGSCRWNAQVFDLRVEQPREHVVLRRVVAVQRAQRDAGLGRDTLTRTAAREWAATGVTVNALCPAAKSQAFFRAIGDYPELEAMADAANPMGRMGDPYDDIAPVAVFLASEACRYLTGNTLFVDGGSHINGVAWAPDLDGE